MRKLVLLVCMSALSLFFVRSASAQSGLIPSWEDSSKRFGFQPISNELSVYANVDDSGANRGHTLQLVLINSFKVLTSFTIEFTADYNYDLTPGLDEDHYVELSFVKPVTSFVSVNYQRVISTFEPESINQFGVRLVF
ncbi:MAG: hypothetical protein RBT76_08675 [candidate division Zixibacteria bacterium]|jgi:hypothetical protein|nr:hypothetical protein [candidate division Zixibacteria bacterium]